MIKTATGFITLILMTTGLGYCCYLTGSVWAGIGCGCGVILLAIVSMDWTQ